MDRQSDDICLVDRGTTHTILKNPKFFSELCENISYKVSTIVGSANIIEGSGRAHIVLPNGTHIFIQNALYSSNSKRNMLGFKDIKMNGYHIETIDENKASLMKSRKFHFSY